MINYHLIELKYLGATNYSGSRLKLASLRFPNDSITVPLDYRTDAKTQGLELLNRLGFKISGVGYDEKRGIYIFCSTTFESLKEQQKAVKMLSEQMKLDFNIASRSYPRGKAWQKEHYNIDHSSKSEVKRVRKVPARNTRTATKKKK